MSDDKAWSRYPRLWLRIIRRCYREDPTNTVVALASGVLGLALFPATALALGWAVDTAARAASGRAAVSTAVLAALTVAVAFIAGQLVDEVARNTTMYLTDRVGLLGLDIDVARDILGIRSMDHLERTDFLDRVTLVDRASWQVVYSAWRAVDAVFNVLRLALVLALLGTVSPFLVLLLAFAVIPLWFDSRGRRGVLRAQDAAAEPLRLQRHLYKLATRPDSGKDIRVSGAGPEVTRLQEANWRQAHEGQYRAELVAAGWRGAGWVVFTLGFGAALGFLLYRARHGYSSLGEIVLAITVATNLRMAVQRAVESSTETAMAAKLVDPYLWLQRYAAERAVAESGGVDAPTRLRHGITIEGLGYRYPGTERQALSDVTVRLPAGSVVAVVGEFGSGKTTLVKLLCKFHRPDCGAIRVDGVDLADIDAGSWWGGSAVAFQDFGRYQSPFSEVVGMGDLPNMHDEAAVRRALAAADAQLLLARLPQGLDTQLGGEFGGVELSEGQWQKTALARACMRTEPLLFVLDEPTASLDAPSEQAIFEHYFTRARDLAQRTGAITVIVSHRFSTVAGADLILVLDKGKLAQVGTHAELVDADGPYAELHAITSAAYTG